MCETKLVIYEIYIRERNLILLNKSFTGYTPRRKKCVTKEMLNVHSYLRKYNFKSNSIFEFS
uniref:Uncharacterized protein n=1 Tax=Octopus bimaculoides TaxID=37653 RepID=A0A0L8H2C7_OCTBM